MAPTTFVLLCLFATVFAAPENIFDKIKDKIEDVAEDVKEAVGVPIFQSISDACRAVKKLVVPIVTHKKDPDVNEMQIYFLHSDGSKDVYSINEAAEKIPKSKYFNPDQKLYLYIHGYTDNPIKSSFGNLSEAFLSQGDSNVLALNASSLIGSLYLRSTSFVSSIGQKLAAFLAALVKEGIKTSEIHIIGHSLGAQVAGLTGKSFTNQTGEKIGRITGLDAAGPCFTNRKDLRLNKTDADFVDMIHTDAGIEGHPDELGQVDFYPNSGANQPGCKPTDSSCSHHRAWQLYSESIINPEAFPAVKCSSWEQFKKGQCSEDTAYMGLAAQKGLTGRYYLQTGAEYPYSLGQKCLTYHDIRTIFKNGQTHHND